MEIQAKRKFLQVGNLTNIVPTFKACMFFYTIIVGENSIKK